MGLETRCKAKIYGKECEGRLHVDSVELTFSGEWKWGVALGQAVTAGVRRGWLRVTDGDMVGEFFLGEAAETWKAKVLHPPTRLKKLGVVGGMTVRTWGELDAAFVAELDEAGCRRVERGVADVYLFAFWERTALGALGIVMDRMPKGKNLWVVFPKGGKGVREAEVMGIAMAAGMGASKTLSFSKERTGLRFARKQ
jgi:hypothetical protein